jgi:hypothetical protein
VSEKSSPKESPVANIPYTKKYNNFMHGDNTKTINGLNKTFGKNAQSPKNQTYSNNKGSDQEKKNSGVFLNQKQNNYKKMLEKERKILTNLNVKEKEIATRPLSNYTNATSYDYKFLKNLNSEGRASSTKNITKKQQSPKFIEEKPGISHIRWNSYGINAYGNKNKNNNDKCTTKHTNNNAYPQQSSKIYHSRGNSKIKNQITISSPILSNTREKSPKTNSKSPSNQYALEAINCVNVINPIGTNRNAHLDNHQNQTQNKNENTKEKKEEKCTESEKLKSNYEVYMNLLNKKNISITPSNKTHDKHNFTFTNTKPPQQHKILANKQRQSPQNIQHQHNFNPQINKTNNYNNDKFNHKITIDSPQNFQKFHKLHKFLQNEVKSPKSSNKQTYDTLLSSPNRKELIQKDSNPERPKRDMGNVTVNVNCESNANGSSKPKTPVNSNSKEKFEYYKKLHQQDQNEIKAPPVSVNDNHNNQDDHKVICLNVVKKIPNCNPNSGKNMIHPHQRGNSAGTINYMINTNAEKDHIFEGNSY